MCILFANAVVIGVGKVGIAGIFGAVANWFWEGVFGDGPVSSSILETERLRTLRFLREEDEKFFLIPPRDGARPGDPDRGSSSPLWKLKFCVGVGGVVSSFGGMDSEP